MSVLELAVTFALLCFAPPMTVATIRLLRGVARTSEAGALLRARARAVHGHYDRHGLCADRVDAHLLLSRSPPDSACNFELIAVFIAMIRPMTAMLLMRASVLRSKARVP